MQSKPVLLVAAVLLGVLAVVLLRGSCSSTGSYTYRDEAERLLDLGVLATFACEACGAQTQSSFRPTPFACPQCGKVAMVESSQQQCLACNKTFEAFRRRSVMSSDGKRPVAFEIRLPGGEWQRGRAPQAKCPHCGNSAPATLRPAAPPDGAPIPPPLPGQSK